MKIIELCGNPGSGKSTIAKRLKEQLESEGYSVIDVRRPFNGYRGILRILIKTKIAMMYRMNGEARKLYRLVHDFTGEKDTEQSDKWAVRLQRLAYVYSWANGKCDYLIADEGPIQYLTSFFYQSVISDMPKDLKREILSKFYGLEYCILSVSAPIEENMKRIKDRDKFNDRFNSENSEEMFRLLEIKNTNIQNVIRFLELENVHELDNSLTVEATCSKATEVIREKLSER